MSSDPTVVVDFKREHEDAVLPTKGSEEASGWDLYSNEEVRLYPGQPTLIKTGWKIAIPTGYEGQVRPRSGLALKKGITVLNSPGTIDSDYRGSLGVMLVNITNESVTLPAKTRIAQLVIQKVPNSIVVEITELSETERGEGGFGSTGMK